jgi:hypothetical protein
MEVRAEFNFTAIQQERFNVIYAETKKIYPNLVSSEIQKNRVKVLIAHSIINDDKVINLTPEIKQEVFDEIQNNI